VLSQAVTRSSIRGRCKLRADTYEMAASSERAALQQHLTYRRERAFGEPSTHSARHKVPASDIHELGPFGKGHDPTHPSLCSRSDPDSRVAGPTAQGLPITLDPKRSIRRAPPNGGGGTWNPRSRMLESATSRYRLDPGDAGEGCCSGSRFSKVLKCERCSNTRGECELSLELGWQVAAGRKL
jgi:hypothetical protein